MNHISDPNIIYDEIVADNPQVTLDEQTFWLVEGDLLMDAARVRTYAIARAEEAQRQLEGEAVNEQERALAIAGNDGRLVRWSKGKVLTYCVRRPTFGGNEWEYQQVVAAIHQATQDWEAVCAVKFRHLAEFDQDSIAGADSLLFDVQRANQYPNVLAWAFFPDSKKSERHIWIEAAFFNPSRNPYTMEGVLRHELGHVLGFRHEHIREGAPLSCGQYAEPLANTAPLTTFDPTSVMHYMCPNVTLKNPSWQLSPKDIEGAQALYGTPDGKIVPPDHKMDYRD